MKTKLNKWRPKSKFNPSRADIQSAVDKFIKNGGSIKKIDLQDTKFEEYLNRVDHDADYWLRGEL